jgi:hypothetical protein
VWARTLHLGTEYDQDLRDALTQALREAGVVRLRHARSLASGEIETWYYRAGFRLLRVRAETYVGLTIRGPSRLVERLAARVRGLHAASAPAIRIEGWANPPEPEVLRALTGQVVAAYVPVRFEGSPIPFEEFFRLARVGAVARLPHPARCTRCEQDSRFRVDLCWERGYVSPDGDVACENCISGRVTGGVELIDFPSGSANV